MPETKERPVASISADPVSIVGSPQSSSLPRASTPDPPWPDPTSAHGDEWDEFARLPHVWEGEILCGLLRNEGVPAVAVSLWPGPDLRGYSIVWVPRGLAHRARWILSWPAPGEAELTFLATGEFPAPAVIP